MKTILYYANFCSKYVIYPVLVLIASFLPYNASSQDVKEEWAKQYNTQEARFDFQEGNKLITTDAEGNTYVVANSTSTNSTFRITTIKYSASGEELWTEIYEDTFNENASATAIALDNYGNAYITGFRGSLGNGDYLTISYRASDGEQRWVNTYTGSSNDKATAITVDNAGNVFVTGTSWGGALNHEDYATIRYNAADGSQVWVKTYSGAKGVSDAATAIAVDNAGSVYVTGYAVGAGDTMEDYATIRYNVSDGSEIWVSTFNGERNFSDYARAIAVDNAGGVFVTGWTSTGTYTDYATVRYNTSDGRQTWVQTYNGTGNAEDQPTDIAVDNTGGVYVTGYSDGGNSKEDYATIRYNTATGNQDWVSRFDGEGNGNDRANAIAVDNIGGVYVTGNSYGGATTGDNYTTLRYDASDGRQVWSQNYNGSGNGKDVANAIVAGTSGVFVTGTSIGTISGQDITTIRYNPKEGNQLWKQTYNSSGSANNAAVDVVIDAEGNSYVTGTSESATSVSSIVTIKYSPSGEVLWLSTFKDAISRSTATAITMDNTGGIFVTGTSGNGVITIRYNSTDGSQAWASIYKEGNGTEDITVDNVGGVYITGRSSFNTSTGTDFLIVRYNAATGEQDWVNDYDTGSLYDNATQVVTDSQGGIYITGQSSIPRISQSENHTVIKYSATTGDQLWVNNYDTPFRRVSTAITLDNSGNLYVTGYSTEAGTVDFITMRLNTTDGSQVWASTYKTSGHTGQPEDITVDNAGGVYITGYSYNANVGENNFTTIRYDAETGNQHWISYFGMKDSGFDLARKVLVDNAGGVYVTGTSWSAATGEVYSTVKYASGDGTLLWNIHSDGTNDLVAAMGLDAEGNIFVTGRTFENSTGTDFLTIKYSQQGQDNLLCFDPLQVQLSLPPHAVRAGEQVRTTADFGDYVPGEAHNIYWMWGDQSQPTIAYFTRGDSHITGEHTYTQAGIYRVGLDFSESCLISADETYKEWLVIYDPNAGSVTGGGQLLSLQTSLPWMSQQLNAQFSFNVRYDNINDTAPQGQTQLNLQDQGIFRSNFIEWLVVNGNQQAIWQGTGTLNGQGNYGFTASVWDGRGTGADDTSDEIRIQIWDKNAGNTVVYDNFETAGDIYDMTNPTSRIVRGHIIIHPFATASKSATQQATLYNYPNTFKDKTTITFAPAKAGTYRLEVYDMRGKLVKQLWQGQAEEGQRYSLELDGTSLPKGIYVARLVSSTGAQSIKMLLER